MERRQFISNTTGYFCGAVLCPALHPIKSYSNAKATHHSISDLELLGIQQPSLFGKGFNLRKPAAEAFQKMIFAAKKDGIELYSLSSYRSFERQKNIWNSKYRALLKKKIPPQKIIQNIIRYSSIPGTSRHHWGTDLDIIDNSKPRPSDPLLTEHYLQGGIYHDLYQWLKKNGASFGFEEVYTNDPLRTGYAYEPWHWSYSELSIPYLKQYLTIDLQKHWKARSIEGHTAFDEAFIDRFKREWVLGVNPGLIPE